MNDEWTDQDSQQFSEWATDRPRSFFHGRPSQSAIQRRIEDLHVQNDLLACRLVEVEAHVTRSRDRWRTYGVTLTAVLVAVAMGFSIAFMGGLL